MAMTSLISSSLQRARMLAQSLECRVGEISSGACKSRPAVFGGAGRFASTLKANGGHWDRSHKAHVFDDWETLAASLTHAAHRMGHPAPASESRAFAACELPDLLAKARRACEETRSTVERSLQLRETMTIVQYQGTPPRNG